MSLFPGVPINPQAEFYSGLAKVLKTANQEPAAVSGEASTEGESPVIGISPEELPRAQAIARFPGGEDPRENAIQQFIKASGLPEDIARKLVHTESSGDTEAVSPKGARGLFQLTPPALKDLGLGEDVLGDPFREAEAAGGYFNLLRKKYKASSLPELIAAYNAGPDVIGKPPEEWPEETRQYVAKILSEETPQTTAQEKRAKKEPAKGKDDVRRVLEKNSDKEWVQRILTGDPRYVQEGEDSYATHKLAWGEGEGGKYYVFPTVYPDEPGGPLREHSAEEAARHAKEAGEAVVVDDPDLARRLAAGEWKEEFLQPGETEVDEAGEPIAETPEGEPVTTGEVEQDPLEAAREVTPDEEEALLSPEDEEHLRKIIESAELTPTQRLGIAILAIQHPEMAMQMLSQAQAGRARAVQAGLNILRERMIGKRMERKQEDMLFRQQVNEFHRRHRELLDQMAKDGIAIPGADKLPEIPANVETPEELESANAALDAWLQAYSAVKTEVNERKEKVTNVQKALNLSRQGGNGSSLIKTLYPKWRDDPELRDAVRQMETQEQAAAEAQKAEIERLQREGERALKQAQKYDADTRRLQVLAQKDVAVAARETEKTAAEIDAEIAKLADQRMMYEVLASRQWTKAGAKPYEDAITRIDLALDRLRQARARVDTIAATLETGGSLENALRGRGLRDPEEAYKVLDGTITTSRSWQIPGAPKGYTLGWFIDSALKKGNLELVRKYGPAVARKVYQEAYRWTGNPMLAQQLAMKWIQDHTEGAWFFQRPMERFAGEGPLEQQMAEYLNAQTAQQLQGQAQGQE